MTNRQAKAEAGSATYPRAVVVPTASGHIARQKTAKNMRSL
ncbi:MAG: hypothetical protein JWP38_2282 [Herbaspirillum sp.]|nr:hypothetical protein [Herbaspirillum sp.]